MSPDISVTIVIRSVGERTASVCRALVEHQFGGAEVVMVNVRPFTTAVRRSYEIGIEAGKRWTLCIDADVLVVSGGLSDLMSYADDLADETLFEVQGVVLDKLFGLRRPAGNHLYRTALLARALRHIPEVSNSLRPESDVINRMAKCGYPWLQHDQVIGLHDYEQYYKDVYRKVYLQARKFGQFKDFILDYWQRHVGADGDYRVAQQAWCDSELSGDDICADAVEPDPGKISNVLDRLGLVEKKPIDEASVWQEKITGMVDRYTPVSALQRSIEERMTPVFHTRLGLRNRRVDSWIATVTRLWALVVDAPATMRRRKAAK